MQLNKARIKSLRNHIATTIPLDGYGNEKPDTIDNQIELD